MTDREQGRAQLDAIADDFLARPDVAFMRMFGAEGLAVRGKVFAFIASDGCLVAKLPESRIPELGLDNMVMRGRAMREWARVPAEAGADEWRAVAEEAYAFLDEITPR